MKADSATEKSGTIRQALQKACEALNDDDAHSSARLDAEVLLAWLLRKDRSYLFAHPEKRLQPAAQAQFDQLIKQRAQGVPVAYLIESRDFHTLTLYVTPDTLIPRPETEHLVEQALQLGDADDDWRVLELGTGSGAIALALAAEKPGWRITATDISTAALAVAQHNAQQHNPNQVQFILSDWFANITTSFDLIISNPPYIAADDPHLQQGDVRHEPSSALIAGPDGLDDIRLIIEQAKDYLEPTGWLIFEHGFTQGMACRDLLQQHGYQHIATTRDLAGHERLSAAQYPP